MNWWTGRGSNPRPPECHSGALPTELPAHLRGALASAFVQRHNANMIITPACRGVNRVQHQTRNMAAPRGAALSPSPPSQHNVLTSDSLISCRRCGRREGYPCSSVQLVNTVRRMDAREAVAGARMRARDSGRYFRGCASGCGLPSGASSGAGWQLLAARSNLGFRPGVESGPGR